MKVSARREAGGPRGYPSRGAAPRRRTELDERVRPAGGIDLVPILGHELFEQLLQVVEGQPLRVRLLREAHVADAVLVDVAAARRGQGGQRGRASAF